MDHRSKGSLIRQFNAEGGVFERGFAAEIDGINQLAISWGGPLPGFTAKCSVIR
jgi:hypothetical protein